MAEKLIVTKTFVSEILRERDEAFRLLYAMTRGTIRRIELKQAWDDWIHRHNMDGPFVWDIGDGFTQFSLRRIGDDERQRAAGEELELRRQQRKEQQ